MHNCRTCNEDEGMLYEDAAYQLSATAFASAGDPQANLGAAGIRLVASAVDVVKESTAAARLRGGRRQRLK
jgi:hypothetical protein